jgi:LacI family transcriptional regulator
MPPRKGAATRGRSSGSPQHGEKRPTINDVARLADVSKKTVSRVINNSAAGARRDTRTRGRGREHSASPDPQARGLASRRSSLIGLICADPLPQSVVEIQQGILDVQRLRL